MKRRILAVLLGFAMVLSDVSPVLAAGVPSAEGSGEIALISEYNADGIGSTYISGDDSSEDVSSNDDEDEDTDDIIDDSDEDDDSDTDDIVDSDEPTKPGDITGNDDAELPEFPEIPEEMYDSALNGHHDIDIDIQSVTDLPDGYISNDRSAPTETKYITAKLPNLRNQNPYGACWSFASMALAEINLMKKGYSAQDLSELHLCYFSYNTVYDPLGGLNGDKNAIGTSGKNVMTLGGNVFLAGSVLSTWAGAADESKYPYSSASTVISKGYSSSKAQDDKAHMVGYYVDTMSLDNIGSVKRLVKDYGAASVSFYALNSLTGATNSNVYKSSTNAYYNPSSKSGNTNHAVVIVGWDDDFPKSNFASQPAGNGAWLIRNSWTTGNINTKTYYGYFWMSYYEPSIQSSKVVSYDFEMADNYDNNYQYDGSMQSGSYSVSSGKYANIFKACSNNGAGAQNIKAASFYTPTSNVTYTIQLYTDLTSANNPESGQLRNTVSGTTTFAGYYTVPFDSPIHIDSGEKFAIVVTLRKGSSFASIGKESNANTWYVSTAYSTSGQSFYYNGSGWTDYGNYNYGNYRIKAFTDNVVTYNVTFDANGGLISGNTTSSKAVEGKTEYGELPLPTREGYSFDGWFTAASGGTEITSTTVMNAGKDHTLYAHWTPNPYTVSFEGNGGALSAGTATSKDVVFDAAYGDLPVPLRTGYTFAGWYTLAVGGDEITSKSKVTIPSEHILYAHWTANTYSVFFKGNGGTVSVKSMTVTFDSAYGELPTATRTAMVFDGWYTAETGGNLVSADTIVSTAQEHNLYAHWSEQVGWVSVGRNTFYVEEGVGRVTGWQTIDGKIHYFDPETAQLKTGWTTVDGNTYYLDPSDKGNKLTNKLIKSGSRTYYVGADGTRKTGFVSVTLPDSAVVTMYFDPSSGSRVTGWLTLEDGEDQGTYYMDPSYEGQRKTGWVTVSGNTYHMDGSGKMETGEIVVDGKTYIMSETGERQTGWIVNDAGETVYADPETGIVKSASLVEENGSLFYTDANGITLKDSWQTVDGYDYYFGSDGKALKNWQEINGKKYYFDDSAKAVSNVAVIDKKLYFFDTEAGDGAHSGLFTDGSKTINGYGLDSVTFTADKDGVLSNGNSYYVTIDDAGYLIDRNGNAVTGWVEKDRKRIYFDASTGKMAAGVKKIGFKTYYFKEDGADKGVLYTSGTVTVNGIDYKIRSDGSLVTGWSMSGYKPKPAENTPGVHNDSQNSQTGNADNTSQTAQTLQPDTAAENIAAPAAVISESPAVTSSSQGAVSESLPATAEAEESSLTEEIVITDAVEMDEETVLMINAANAESTADLETITFESADYSVISEGIHFGYVLPIVLLLVVMASVAGIVIVRKRIELA